MMIAENNQPQIYMQNQLPSGSPSQFDIEKGTMEMQEVHSGLDENVSNNSAMNNNGFVKPQDQL